jgi:hypothetical protein
MITRLVRPDNLSSWLRTNAAAVVTANPGKTTLDTWRAYLKTTGATGSKESELEHSYLTTLSVPGGKLEDRWRAYLGTQGKSGPTSSAFKSQFK